MPGASSADNKAFKFTYLTFADLARWQQSMPVRSIQINDNVASRGGWVYLSKLPNLQYITYTGEKTESMDSLFRAVSGLPVRYVSVMPNYNGSPIKTTLVIPGSIKNLTKLVRLILNGVGLDLEKSLGAVAEIRSLRELLLTIEGNQVGGGNQFKQVARVPDALGQLTQLTKLQLSTLGKAMANAPIIGRLTGLQSLLINGYGGNEPVVKTEQQAFGKALLALTNLREVALPADWLDAAFRPDWTQLQNLTLNTFGEKKALSFNLGPLPSLEKLILQNVTLVGDLCASTKLVHLTLGGANVKQFPACIGQLKNLQTLSISTSILQTVSPSIGELSSLTALYLSGKGIDSLPDVFGKLTQLKTLVVSNSQLVALPPSVGQLRQLTNLNLANNKLTQLPETLDKLNQLLTLNVSDNQLTSLPERLGSLTGLQVLMAANNQLEQLPATIGNLSKLNLLSLNKNALRTLPVSIGSLDSLKDLSVDNNKLTTLPPTIGNLRSLRSLWVNNNQLTELPESMGKLSALRSLQVSNNPLVALPTTIGSLTALTSLSFNKTKIKLLPPGIGQLRRLESLWISESELLTLPSEIGNCHELRTIILHQNPLIGLPESMGRLQKLTNLSISGPRNVLSKLMNLPDSLRFCTALTMLEVSNFPNLSANEALVNLLKLPALTQLTISQTPLSLLPTTGWKESKINRLQLHSNGLTELPPALLDAPNLKAVSLFGNPLPRSLATSFESVEQLRVGMAEAGWVSLDNPPKTSWPIAQAYMQSAARKGWMRDWASIAADLDKALAYAPDTAVALVYAHRAEVALGQKQYEKAIADFDKALANWPLLRVSLPQFGRVSVETSKKIGQAVWWMRKGMAQRGLGQVDVSLSSINQAISLFSMVQDSSMERAVSPTEAQLFTEQGNTLVLKSRFIEADSAYSRAMKAYEALPYPELNSQLTLVELGIVTGQYDRARKALDRIPAYWQRDDIGILFTYLANALKVAEGKITGPEAIQSLQKNIASSSGRIMNWRFDLFDSWLNRTTLPAEKRDALRELTKMAKERQLKMD